MNAEPQSITLDHAAESGTAASAAQPAPEQEAADAYEPCLLAMARAVQGAGMYGAKHPSAQQEIESWFEHLSPLLRSRGSLALGSDGQTAFVDGNPFSTTNPIVLAMLRKLHAARAGVVEMRSGFRVEDASHLAEFLATVDANHLASDDSAIEAWIDRTGIRHVKVRPLIFREVKEGGRIISGDRPRPHQHTPTTDKTSRRQPGPEEAKTWARDFRRQRARADASATLPPEIRDEVAAHLRSAAPDQTAISAY